MLANNRDRVQYIADRDTKLGSCCRSCVGRWKEKWEDECAHKIAI